MNVGAASHMGNGAFGPTPRLVAVLLLSLLLCLKGFSLVAAPHAESGLGPPSAGGWSGLVDRLCGSGDGTGVPDAGECCCLASVDTIGSGSQSWPETVKIRATIRLAPHGRREASRRFAAGWASAWSAQSPPRAI